jgi:hypothetical protein
MARQTDPIDVDSFTAQPSPLAPFVDEDPIPAADAERTSPR